MVSLKGVLIIVIGLVAAKIISDIMPRKNAEEYLQ
jgi:hypothetical protein